jgi:hypothetical protein
LRRRIVDRPVRGRRTPRARCARYIAARRIARYRGLSQALSRAWARLESTRSNSTIWAVAAERTKVGPLGLAVEALGDNRDPAWINFAVRWHMVPEVLFLDASYGFQASSERPKLLTIGAKFAFSF